jgi:hypothetical protein
MMSLESLVDLKLIWYVLTSIDLLINKKKDDGKAIFKKTEYRSMGHLLILVVNLAWLQPTLDSFSQSSYLEVSIQRP